MAARQVLYDGGYLRLMSENNWEFVERANARGAVIIVAVTEDDRLLLVEQHRVPMAAAVVELPAGLVGDVIEAEPLAEAAARELEEETGYRAGRLEPLVEGPPSPGLASERMSFFRALAVRRIGPGGGDDSEDITVHAVPLAQVEDWLASRRQAGKLVDPKVYIALYFLRDRLPPLP